MKEVILKHIVNLSNKGKFEMNLNAVIYCGEVTSETMGLIDKEVRSSFTRNEIILMSDFEDFFSEIDIQNAFEEGWEEHKNFYRPFYEAVYENILKGK
jgi:hypothetical protein